jgi:DNA polymerase-2
VAGCRGKSAQNPFSGEPRGDSLVNARLKPHPDYRPQLKWVSLDIETSGS